MEKAQERKRKLGRGGGEEGLLFTIAKAHIVLVVYLRLFRVEPAFWAELVNVGAVDGLISVDEPWIASGV